MNRASTFSRRWDVEAVGGWLMLLCLVALFQTLFVVGPATISQPSDGKVLDHLFWLWRLWIIRLLPLVIVVALVPRRLPARRAWRWPLLALTALAGAGLGWAAGYAVGPWNCGCKRAPAAWQWAYAHDVAVAALMLITVVEYRRRSGEARMALHAAVLARLELEREVAAARLQLLQAQVEPHFLFNTLANVRRLLRTDLRLGRMMMADLLRYLESALPQLRDEVPTLEREMEVIRAYLGVHRVRMGSRLAVEFDIPPELRPRTVPPLMLLTLVENAIKHGLQPLSEGGSIRVVARAGRERLRVEVADTGRGLGSGAGSGAGLANIRARLRAMYGPAGTLSLQLNQPRGVVASIEFPSAA